MRTIAILLASGILSACVGHPQDTDDDGGILSSGSGQGGATGSGGASSSTDVGSRVSATSNSSNGSNGSNGSTGNGTSSGSSGNGGSSGFDLVNCTGPASTTGSIYNVTPNPTIGYVWPDPSGNIAVALYPGSLATSTGDITVGVYFYVAPNQLDYPPNGTVGCAVLEDNGSGWNVIDTTQLCEVHLTTLQMASAPDVCDGVLEGSFQGIFSGNQPLAGVFSVPVEVAWSQTSGGPPCQPPNGPCSMHSDCCSQSCSMFIGVCN
jgi:hypothetical protein